MLLFMTVCLRYAVYYVHDDMMYYGALLMMVMVYIDDMLVC